MLGVSAALSSAWIVSSCGRVAEQGSVDGGGVDSGAELESASDSSTLDISPTTDSFDAAPDAVVEGCVDAGFNFVPKGSFLKECDGAGRYLCTKN